MAIESTQVIDILSKKGEAATKAEELIAMFSKDTEEQLTSIKMNKEQILEEKRDSEAKRKALQEQLNELAAKNEDLSKQLAAASPEEVKKFYEQKLTDQSNIHEKQKAEIMSVLDTYKSQVSDLKRSRLKLECMQEFNKAIEGKNIAPDAIGDFSDFVLGYDCSKFDRRPVGDGKEVIATKDGITIEAAIKQALTTTFGKRCVMSNSTGGGAEGFAYTNGTIDNPFKSGNITQQMELFAKDPELAAKLEAQAKRA